MDAHDTDTPILQPEYGVEVLCASWNPAASAVAEAAGHARERPAERSVDVDAFLRQFYLSQHS